MTAADQQNQQYTNFGRTKWSSEFKRSQRKLFYSRFSLPNRKAPYHPVHTGPIADRYVDQLLPGGTAKISHRRLISAACGRFRLSAVDFDYRRSIDGEIDRRWPIEEEKGKRRGKEERRSTWPPSLPARCPRALAVRGSPARHHRPRNPWATIVPARGDETSPHAGRETEATSDKAPYLPVHTGPIADRYAHQPLPGGTAKISHRRLISAACGRFRLSTVDGRLTEKSTVGGRLKKKKGKEERRRSTWPPSLPARCPRALAVRGSPARHRRPRNPWATIVPARGDETTIPVPTKCRYAGTDR
ncbi:hypothetical protein GW17_00003982 [Ensete ventricosum]|nr:hypothetical protein GW17_00003982 [Ensete ventricosum]